MSLHNLFLDYNLIDIGLTLKDFLVQSIEHMFLSLLQGKVQKNIGTRKNDMSMNVLVICNMDMLFTYVYIGILGSAHDAKVLGIEGPHQFSTAPFEKYYLGDFGYFLRHGFLTPYKKGNILS